MGEEKVERVEKVEGGVDKPREFTPWTNRLIVAGIIGISITGMALDFTGGKDLAILGMGGLLGFLTK